MVANDQRVRTFRHIEITFVVAQLTDGHRYGCSHCSDDWFTGPAAVFVGLLWSNTKRKTEKRVCMAARSNSSMLKIVGCFRSFLEPMFLESTRIQLMNQIGVNASCKYQQCQQVSWHIRNATEAQRRAAAYLMILFEQETGAPATSWVGHRSAAR